MRNSPNILDMVKSLTFLLSRNTSSRFTRVDALQDTQSSKVLDCHLQHLETLGSSDETRLQTDIFFLLLFSHARKLALRSHLGMAGRLYGLLLGTSLHAISHGVVVYKRDEEG